MVGWGVGWVGDVRERDEDELAGGCGGGVGSRSMAKRTSKARMEREIAAVVGGGGGEHLRMMSANRGETLDPPRRVKILRVEDQRPSSYFKVGQFGYARVRHTTGGFATRDAGESKPGQAVYAVSKAKDGRGGAVWFTEDGIRITER